MLRAQQLSKPDYDRVGETRTNLTFTDDQKSRSSVIVNIAQSLILGNVAPDLTGLSPFRQPEASYGKDDNFLLQHYVEHTAPKLIANSDYDSLLKCVLPIATIEPALMQVLLAMSGSHLNSQTNDPQYKVTTMKCYALATSALQNDVTIWRREKSPNFERTLYLLATTLLLYQYEAIAGNPGASGHFHLRASRDLIETALQEHSRPYEDERFSFLTEYYSYFAICSNITANCPARLLLTPSDVGLRSLRLVATRSMFGSMLGCGSGLFELIPLVCGYHSRQPPLSTIEYESLEQSIMAWTLPEPPQGKVWRTDQIHLACAYQTALLIYARYIYKGHHETRKTFVDETRSLINDFLDIGLKVIGSSTSTTLMWPTLVVGSFFVDDFLRTMICLALKGTGFDFTLTDRAVQVLERTWAISNEHMYGIDALDLAVQEFDFCMS